MEKFLFWLVMSCIGLVVAGLLYIIYLTIVQSNAPTFELYKSQWRCIETRTEYVHTTMLVGKVPVPQTYPVTVCINYVRK